jgi:outer membrane protein TolC
MIDLRSFLTVIQRTGAGLFGVALASQAAIASPGAGELSPLPSASELEGLGAGWPASEPKPVDRLAPIPAAQLAKLDLEAAVILADQRNPVVRQNYEDLIATQNSLGAAYASWWPVVNASINAGMYGGRAYYNYPGALTGVGAPPTDPPNPFANKKSFSSSYFQSIVQFDINWNLFDPARGPTIWQGKYLVRQAVDTFLIARRDNRLRTEEAFINIQKAMAKILTSADLVSNDQILLNLTQSRLRIGVASRLDLAKQTTVLKGDQVNLVNARSDFEQAQASLASLLNDAQASLIVPADPLAPLGVWTFSIDDTLQAAFNYRKVIEQQLTAVKINQAQAQIDLAVYKPTISLVNTLYWTKGVGYTALGPPWVTGARSDLWDASSLFQLTFTGFDGGRARMEAAASRRRAMAAEQQVQQVTNQVREEVQRFYSQVQQGRAAVLISAQRVQSASDSLRLQSLRFSVGFANITDVVQAQQDLTQSVGDYIEQLYSYNLALVSLSRASGLAYQEDQSFNQQLGDPLDRLRLPNLSARQS